MCHSGRHGHCSFYGTPESGAVLSARRRYASTQDVTNVPHVPEAGGDCDMFGEGLRVRHADKAV